MDLLILLNSGYSNTPKVYQNNSQVKFVVFFDLPAKFNEFKAPSKYLNDQNSKIVTFLTLS